MKATEAKAICPDCVPFWDVNGKVRLCKHLDPTNGDLCLLPKNFTCIVRDHIKRMQHANRTSHSRTSTFHVHPWNRQKEKLIPPISSPPAHGVARRRRPSTCPLCYRLRTG